MWIVHIEIYPIHAPQGEDTSAIHHIFACLIICPVYHRETEKSFQFQRTSSVQPWPPLLWDHVDNISQQIEGFIWLWCH